MSDAGRFGRWSLRAKVRVALLGVLLLILPQIGLTLYYMDRIRDIAREMAHQSALLAHLSQLRDDLRDLSLPLRPSEASDHKVTLFVQQAEALRALAENLPVEVSPKHTQLAQDLQAALASARTAGEGWFQVVRGLRLVIGDDQVLDSAALRTGEVGSQLKQARESFSEAQAVVADMLQAATVEGLAGARREEAFARRVVDHADRNLFTLTMLTFVFLAVLFVALPERLVRPLRRLTQVIRAAARGPEEVRLPRTGDDELGTLANVFNETMDTLQQFDERKRDRIFADGAKIDTLLRRLDTPAVILNAHLLVDAVNPAFREAFGLTAEDLDRPLPTLFREGGDALRQLLVRAMSQGEVVANTRVELRSGGGEPTRYRAQLDLCRDRRGRAASVILMLNRDEPAEGA